jgi:uncharacterized protein (TIGR02118 family)
MVYISTVLYPSGPDAIFDMKYYVGPHFELVEKYWRPHGMQSWEVVELEAGPGGSKPYNVAAIITWKDVAGFREAMKTEGTRELIADAAKCTNQNSVVLTGSVVGSGKSA